MHINSVKDYKCIIIIHEVQKIVYSIFTINLLLKCENLKPAKICVVWWYFNSKQCMVFDHVDKFFINLLFVTSNSSLADSFLLLFDQPFSSFWDCS